MTPKSALAAVVFCLAMAPATAIFAQQAAPKWTPEERKELFNYCEKPELVKQLRISEETADRIGEIHAWALQQKLSVEANTNPAYATPNEVEEDVIKKYKALRLSGDQVKSLTERRQANPDGVMSCAVTTISPDKTFDTLTAQKALQLYKTKYRKALITKLDINGRQADMLFDAEVWKQKEMLSLDAIPATDFNRIRKTVDMYRAADVKVKAIGLTDQQLQAAADFFRENKPR
jgi:hypothetical protein